MKTGTIHSSRVEHGRNHVIYSITDSKGKVHGPWPADTEQTPEDFLAQRVEAFYEEPDYYAILQAAIDGNVGAGAYDKLREELKNLGVTEVQLGDVKMNVTYPTATDPEDARARLAERVDADLAPGKLDEIAAVLTSLGFGEAKLVREQKITL